MNYSLIPFLLPEKKGLARQKGVQQSDHIRDPFFILLIYGNLKTYFNIFY